MSQQSGLAETRGHSLIWEQKWEAALKEFEIALKENPDNPTIHDGIATAKRELGDIQGALQHFEKAAELTEQNTIYLRQVADLQQKMGAMEDAAETFMRIGEKHLSQKRLTDAIDNWVLATRFNSDHLKAHERLAKVYENQDRPWLAVNEFLETARIYENQGQLNRALRACERAIKIDPRNAEALTAAELLKTGERAFPNNSRGMIDQNKAISRMSSTGSLVSGMVEIPVAAPIAEKLQSAREKMAEDIFSSDSASGEDNNLSLMALVSQGLTNQTQGDNEEAISSFTQVLDKGLRSSAVLFTVAHLHQTLNQFAEAIPLLGEIEGDEDYEFVRLYCIGECFRGLGHIQQAMGHYINALKFIDLPTVEPKKRGRLEAQYDDLLDLLSSEAAVDQATSFALSFGRFLQTNKWETAVEDSRKRLDKLSTEPGSMILGDILNAGSSRILESLQLAQEHAERGLYDSAIEEVYRAIEVSAGYLPAHIQMADLLIHKNKIPQAAQKLQVIGNTFLVRGDKAGAVGAFKKAVNTMPLNMEMRQNLIDLMRDTG
ncbi:MAG: tetratricopeptide repeat protein, partial [Chloroflexota bacterium]